MRALPGGTLVCVGGDQVSTGTGPWTMSLVRGGIRAVDARGLIVGVAGLGMCWRLQTDDPDAEISVGAPAGRPRHYRGSIEIKLAAGGLLVVNEVAIEAYLRGVVASEMGAQAPIEALKAQAVAARTFALCNLGRWVRDGYDVRDNTDSQAYNGIDGETFASDTAVRDTESLILTVGGKPIAAQFSADCGGASTPGAGPDDGPGPVIDTDAHAAQPGAKNHTWTLTFSPERLATILARNTAAWRPGMLDGAEILEKDASGRVKRLRLAWRQPLPRKHISPHRPDGNPPTASTPHSGSSEPYGDDIAGGLTDVSPPLTDPPLLAGDVGSPISKRNAKDKPPVPALSAGSVVTSDVSGNGLRALLGPDVLRSTLFTVRRSAIGEFVLEGKGWGHGRGMCQTGAVALAGPAFQYDFQKILRRYYAGASITHVQFPESEEGTHGATETGTAMSDTQPAVAHYLKSLPVKRNDSRH